jgi:hypothetical protein
METNLLAGGQNNTGVIKNSLLQNTVLDQMSEISIAGNSTYWIEVFVPKLVGLLLVFGALAFFIMFLWGAISWILSGGDKAHVENAKGRITNALIGLILMVAVFAIIGFVEKFFGVNILSIDIGPLLVQ